MLCIDVLSTNQWYPEDSMTKTKCVMTIPKLHPPPLSDFPIMLKKYLELIVNYYLKYPTEEVH